MSSTDPLRDELKKPGMQEGLRVARDVARWHLGDEWWADKIIGALLHPEEAERELARAKQG